VTPSVVRILILLASLGVHIVLPSGSGSVRLILAEPITQRNHLRAGAAVNENVLIGWEITARCRARLTAAPLGRYKPAARKSAYFDISFIDANTGTVVGLGGTILRTTTGGEPTQAQP
jgi:hypothetical protein